MSNDTIVAIATPPGRGGVGIIRVSGNNAKKIGHQLSQVKNFFARQLHFTCFLNTQGDVLDQGLIVYFKAPDTFTGEDIIEFHAHGSPVMLDYLLQQCINCGARLARPGEFTERAFLNDKIDLTQAEAIADLIHASSLTAARMAVKSLQGEFSEQINEISNQLIYVRVYVEAAIDFPEEEVDFLGDGHIASLVKNLLSSLELLRKNATQGSLLREGLSIVIAGKPNAGKSTLINQLAGREVAIVTDIAGTTRDVMREHILLDDLPIHLIDTAGLRESNDVVEREGIRRAWQEVRQADCVLLIIDVNSARDRQDLEEELKSHLSPHVPVIPVYNKIDTLDNSHRNIDPDATYLSAKSGNGIDELKKRIKSTVGYQPAEGTFLARRRHLQALDLAYELLQIGYQQLITNKAGELLAEDLRKAHEALQEITGQFSSDDLLGSIFSSFCIGK